MTDEAMPFIHPSAIVDPGCQIGAGTKVWHFSHLQKGTTIGKNCNLGQNVNTGENVRIGDYVKIQNNVSVYEGVELEDYVFCGPSMVFTNVLNPRCEFPQRGPAHYLKTWVKRGASIGANATIVCGHTLGRYCMVGAGSVVTRDVPDYALVVGNPARVVGWVCRCGAKLAGGAGAELETARDSATFMGGTSESGDAPDSGAEANLHAQMDPSRVSGVERPSEEHSVALTPSEARSMSPGATLDPTDFANFRVMSAAPIPDRATCSKCKREYARELTRSGSTLTCVKE